MSMSHAAAAGSVLSSNVAAVAGSSSKDLPELRNRVRGYVDDAIRQMPLEKKQAYLEATQKCPDLVRDETDPLAFVRYCRYNHWEGAERLCLYWEERKKVFGPDRAFLPLILTGEGALTTEDVQTVIAGYPSLLPKTKSGQQAVLFDRRKWLPKATTANLLRSIFYIFNILAKDDRAQTDEGVLVLACFVAPHIFKSDEEFQKRVHFIGGKCFPVKVHLHIAVVPNHTKRYLLQVQDVFAQALKYMMDSKSVRNNAQHIYSTLEFHFERERGQLVEELQELGLTRESIPLAIGGNWKSDSFFKWCQERREMERERYKFLHNQNNNNNNSNLQTQAVLSSSTLQNNQQGRAKPQRGQKKRSAVSRPQTEQERLEKRRLLDLMHSRRKRERRRQEAKAIQEEAGRAMQENLVLKAEEKRLQDLLAQAQQMVVASLLD